MANTAPIFPGWNVWDVYQTKDLPFGIQWIGVDPNRRIKIFVEDAIKDGAAAAKVADPSALKGSQVEILPGSPSDLTAIARKEDVEGPAMQVDGPVILRTVRFFNRGDAANLVWPHNENFLLDKVYQPTEQSPETTGAPPPTVFQGAGDTAGDILGDVAKGAVKPLEYVLLGGGVYFALKWLFGGKKR